MQAWPLSDELDYEGWLNNFAEGDERNIASVILDFFTHYSSRMVDQIFKTSVSNAGYIFSKHFLDWQHSDFKNRCIYSFIPGETLNPTDSGHLFTRKLRDYLGVDEEYIINYNDLPKRLDQINAPVPIIFVDDFVGSGAQVYKAWNNNRFSYNNKTLSEVCFEGNHCAVYSPLIVNMKGYKVIKNYCDGLHLCAAHILGPEYCLFNKECICWKNDEELFNKGTSLILRKSKELGIPFSDGKDVRDVRGFGEQGLAISFAHGAPDAIPSFFYWSSNNWTPLIRKQYQR